MRDSNDTALFAIVGLLVLLTIYTVIGGLFLTPGSMSENKASESSLSKGVVSSDYAAIEMTATAK